MNWVSRRVVNRSEAGNVTFHNTNRVARILYRLDSYSKLSLHMLRQGVPPSDIVRSQFPFIEPSPDAPVFATLEFTNYCNLRCPYCTSPLGLRPRGFMDRATFDKTLKGLATLGVKRVRVIGNGESTLHPEFESYISELASVVPYVTVLSNGQWRQPEKVVAAALSAPLKMLEISVDASDKASYEASRIGGKFERLIDNLTLLRHERDERTAPTIINLRLMLRPSDLDRQQELKQFWHQYADTVMFQHLVQREALTKDKDLHNSVESVDSSFPKCKLPFTALDINWNGDIPICSMSAQQVGPPGMIIGNVNNDALEVLWNGPTLRQYREGHSKRIEGKMPICKGCIGA